MTFTAFDGVKAVVPSQRSFVDDDARLGRRDDKVVENVDAEVFNSNSWNPTASDEHSLYKRNLCPQCPAGARLSSSRTNLLRVCCPEIKATTSWTTKHKRTWTVYKWKHVTKSLTKRVWTNKPKPARQVVKGRIYGGFLSTHHLDGNEWYGIECAEFARLAGAQSPFTRASDARFLLRLRICTRKPRILFANRRFEPRISVVIVRGARFVRHFAQPSLAGPDSVTPRENWSSWNPAASRLWNRSSLPFCRLFAGLSYRSCWADEQRWDHSRLPCLDCLAF